MTGFFGLRIHTEVSYSEGNALILYLCKIDIFDHHTFAVAYNCDIDRTVALMDNFVIYLIADMDT